MIPQRHVKGFIIPVTCLFADLSQPALVFIMERFSEMIDIFGYCLHNQMRRRCHIVGRRTRAEGDSQVSLEQVTCAVWTHPVLQGKSRHVRTSFGARLTKLPKDGTADGNTMSFWHWGRQLDDEFSFRVGCQVYPWGDPSGSTSCVPHHTSHTSLSIKGTTDMFQLPQACPFETGVNKSPSQYLRSGRGIFRLVSLISLCFAVIHDCVFLSTVIQFCGVWQKMAAPARGSYTKQVLLVRAKPSSSFPWHIQRCWNEGNVAEYCLHCWFVETNLELLWRGHYAFLRHWNTGSLI